MLFKTLFPSTPKLPACDQKRKAQRLGAPHGSIEKISAEIK